MPHFLYIKKKNLQPPIKLAESTLPEQSVVQEELVPTNVPTNPLADLPGLRWNQYPLSPSLINLKRAKRWLTQIRRERGEKRASSK